MVVGVLGIEVWRLACVVGVVIIDLMGVGRVAVVVANAS
jgi:hypothetical protein